MTMAEHRVGAASDLPPGTVLGSGPYAVGNNGEDFAVTRRCRHLRADLAAGTIDPDGCLVCPWHQAKYDVKTGHMLRGPQGIFAKVPGLGAMFIGLTKILPLGRGKIERRGGDIFVS
jgi:nitrite reductase/ring-hydroxylating ferredoxin subunit